MKQQPSPAMLYSFALALARTKPTNTRVAPARLAAWQRHADEIVEALTLHFEFSPVKFRALVDRQATIQRWLPTAERRKQDCHHAATLRQAQ